LQAGSFGLSAQYLLVSLPFIYLQFLCSDVFLAQVKSNNLFSNALNLQHYTFLENIIFLNQIAQVMVLALLLQSLKMNHHRLHCLTLTMMNLTFPRNHLLLFTVQTLLYLLHLNLTVQIFTFQGLSANSVVLFDPVKKQLSI